MRRFALAFSLVPMRLSGPLGPERYGQSHMTDPLGAVIPGPRWRWRTRPPVTPGRLSQPTTAVSGPTRRSGTLHSAP